jgi:peptidyl-Lys metalloendopeptidase
MSSSKSEFAASESVAIDIKLTNTDAINPARILDWFNPCNGAGDAATSSSPVDMSFFNVETAFGGQSALYLGALIKRKEPTDKDYKTLKAGEQISCTINLDKYFQFSAPTGDDAYVISYAVTSMQLSEPFQIQGGSTMESLEAGALTVKVNARTIPTRSVRDQNIRGLQTGSTTFNKCTVAQQGLLIEARKQAKIESTNVVSTIANISQWGNATSCVRHNTWFGPYDGNRFAELKPGYDAISARLNDASIKFDCGCKQK